MKIARSMVLVSTDPESLSLGAQEIFNNFKRELEAFDITEEIALSSIHGVGQNEALPVVIIYPEAVVYGPVKPEDVHFIVEEHLLKGHIAENFQAQAQQLAGRLAWIPVRKGTIPNQQRIVLDRVGVVDPLDIKDYIIHDGYEALGKVLSEMSPIQVINEVKKSGLRGRGGAGFPTGLKWDFVSRTKSDRKYVICNADESEPGTFKDRLVLEGDPFSILEAMTIAGYAVGAQEGFIYIRGEYKLAQERISNAIKQATDMGLLGDNVFGCDFQFHIHIHSGAGAYICGEETALIESIEGKRGEPRARPPYPTTNGLWNRPSLVNNVETLANIPPILRNGASWYNQFGTINSPGTKVYTILGNVNMTGSIEVQMGITLREIINIYGKGMSDGSTFKLAQTGGSSGSIIPASLQDTPLDFDSFNNAGVSLGSGALLICNEDVCVVDFAKVLMNFFRNESCGKCTPCRVGNQRAYDILTKISEGNGSLDDLNTLQYLSEQLVQLSHCGLGQTAATPIRDVLKHFRAEVEAHIRLKVCPCGVCPMSGRKVSEHN